MCGAGEGQTVDGTSPGSRPCRSIRRGRSRLTPRQRACAAAGRFLSGYRVLVVRLRYPLLTPPSSGDAQPGGHRPAQGCAIRYGRRVASARQSGRADRYGRMVGILCRYPSGAGDQGDAEAAGRLLDQRCTRGRALTQGLALPSIKHFKPGLCAVACVLRRRSRSRLFIRSCSSSVCRRPTRFARLCVFAPDAIGPHLAAR